MNKIINYIVVLCVFVAGNIVGYCVKESSNKLLEKPESTQVGAPTAYTVKIIQINKNNGIAYEYLTHTLVEDQSGCRHMVKGEWGTAGETCNISGKAEWWN